MHSPFANASSRSASPSKVQEREAQVGTSVAEEAVRTEKAREKVELELERTRAEIKKLDQ